MRSRSPTIRPTPAVYWLAFLDWLSSGAGGILPFTLSATLGPIWRLLPLARHVAQHLSSWLLERSRAEAQPAEAVDPALARQIAADIAERPLTLAEVCPDLDWLSDLLAADLARLPRLLTAPSECFCGYGWLEWIVRCWALVITLARIGQAYSALETLHSPEVARQVWWQQINLEERAPTGVR
jgi:hypothetical protein